MNFNLILIYQIEIITMYFSKHALKLDGHLLRWLFSAWPLILYILFNAMSLLGSVGIPRDDFKRLILCLWWYRRGPTGGDPHYLKLEWEKALARGSAVCHREFKPCWRLAFLARIRMGSISTQTSIVAIFGACLYPLYNKFLIPLSDFPPSDDSNQSTVFVIHQFSLSVLHIPQRVSFSNRIRNVS
jgi:hypothetical protein